MAGLFSKKSKGPSLPPAGGTQQAQQMTQQQVQQQAAQQQVAAQVESQMPQQQVNYNNIMPGSNGPQ
jgi:hypothetical protein